MSCTCPPRTHTRRFRLAPFKEWNWRNFTHAEVPWGEPITNNCVEVFNRYLKKSLGRQMKHWTHVMQMLLEQMRIESMKQGAHKHLPAIGANSTEAKRVWEAAQQLYACFARRPLLLPSPH